MECVSVNTQLSAVIVAAFVESNMQVVVVAVVDAHYPSECCDVAMFAKGFFDGTDVNTATRCFSNELQPMMRVTRISLPE